MLLFLKIVWEDKKVLSETADSMLKIITVYLL